MSRMISVLVLRLEGVLQSWGEHAKWDFRDSAILPTKSGIIGLLGCALGIARNDHRLSALSRQLNVAVRADRVGKMINDFHTVQSKYLLNALGKPRGKIGEYSTLVTNRKYLQDAYFTVFLIGDKQLLLKLEAALKHPKWPMFLGRKSCVPSRPVLDGAIKEYENIEQALKNTPFADRADDRVVLELEENLSDMQGAMMQRSDVINEGIRNFESRTVMRKIFRRGI